MHTQLILFLLLILSSCSAPISVQMDYLSRRNLASYHVKTPDPRINHPRIGERLIIQWSIPRKYKNLHMLITFRHRNWEEATLAFPLNRHSGTYIYDLTNEYYFSTCGLQTYKIEIFTGDCLLYEWKHQLWTELITFPEMGEDIKTLDRET